jgi:hypothetical protein
MAETVQKNFRMSAPAIKLLHDVARELGTTETEVIQTCVAKYALEIGKDVEQAKELLFQHICRAAANAPVSHARAAGSSAANEEAGRPALPQSATKLHDTASDLHNAVRVAEGIVEKTRKRGAPKKK